jgi:endonuclease III|tara:strand:+ start:100 stop:513 length:414 start_codon:yes stop_codon:yes gene_type:complete
MKKLLQKLGTLFSKKEAETDPVEDCVAELSFYADKEENIYISCSYKEEEECRRIFAHLLMHVNCGNLSSETLEIIYQQCKESGMEREYEDLLSKISEAYRIHVIDNIATEPDISQKSTDPVIKPTQVINSEENADLF